MRTLSHLFRVEAVPISYCLLLLNFWQERRRKVVGCRFWLRSCFYLFCLGGDKNICKRLFAKSVRNCSFSRFYRGYSVLVSTLIRRWNYMVYVTTPNWNRLSGLKLGSFLALNYSGSSCWWIATVKKGFIKANPNLTSLSRLSFYILLGIAWNHRNKRV